MLLEFRHSLIVFTLIISACGGGEGGDTVQDQSPSRESQSIGFMDFSSGTWNASIKFNNTDLTESGNSTKSISRSQLMLDFERRTVNTCDFNFNSNLDVSDYPDDPSILLQTIETDIEQSLGLDFTTTFVQHSNTHITIYSSTSSENIYFTLDYKKVSDSLAFDSGSIFATGDALSEVVDTQQGVCANRSQIQYFGPGAGETEYVFGAPYEDSRLVVTIRNFGMDLTPGEYDLKLDQNIEITVSKIDLYDDAIGEGSTSTLYISSGNSIRFGRLVIDEASESSLKGSFYFESISKGAINADFNVMFPQSDI